MTSSSVPSLTTVTAIARSLAFMKMRTGETENSPAEASIASSTRAAAARRFIGVLRLSCLAELNLPADERLDVFPLLVANDAGGEACGIHAVISLGPIAIREPAVGEHEAADVGTRLQ